MSKARATITSTYEGMISPSARSTMNHRIMRRVYVFSLPVRIFHWINALAITALIVTGIVIGNPPAIQSSAEASNGYWFGTLRYIHFASAWVFTVNWVFRLFYAFVAGNRWETWDNFIPNTKAKWKEIMDVIKIDVLLSPKREHISIGHNALAGFSYFVLFLLSVVMMLTGFGLYSAMTDNWFANLFSWVIPAFGNDMAVRFIHHALMWLFVIFTLIHVYLVFYHDYVEGRGEVSSMGGGWKFVEEDVIQKMEQEESK